MSVSIGTLSSSFRGDDLADSGLPRPANRSELREQGKPAAPQLRQRRRPVVLGQSALRIDDQARQRNEPAPLVQYDEAAVPRQVGAFEDVAPQLVCRDAIRFAADRRPGSCGLVERRQVLSPACQRLQRRQLETGGRALGQETVELAHVGQARIERRDDLCRDGVEAARLDERAPLRVVVDLDGQALHPDDADVPFREVVQLGSDSGLPTVRPDAEPEPADRAGLVPLEGRGGEAHDFAVLQR